MGLPGEITTEQWREILNDFGWCCARCGAHASQIEAIYPGRMVLLEVDHVIPVSRGGANNTSNLQPLCQKCNNWKRARVMDFRPEEIKAKYALQ